MSVETVRNDFGKGDVLVGQAVIDAGLADRFGSFEDALAELATAHGTPGESYTGALHLDADSSSNIKAACDPEEEEDARPDDEQQLDPAEPDDEQDPEEDEEAKQGGQPSAEDAELSAHAPHTTEKGTIVMSEENKTLAELQAQLKAAEERAAQSEASAKEASERIDALETDARRHRLQGLAKDFTGDTSAKVDFMQKLAASFGEDSDELKAYVADQNAVAAQIKASDLFKEVGSSVAGNDQSAYAQLEAKAAEIAKTTSITKEQAFAKAAEALPAIYNAYVAEQRG